jgi:FHS family L-fucose permease-like MFS transporter
LSATIESVKVPYLLLGGLFVLVAVFFWVSKLPRITNEEHVEAGLGALKYPQLILGMSAIFVYVGVEVTIGSNLPEYLKETQGLVSSQVSKYVSLFWGSMMVGRWTASVGNFGLSDSLKKLLCGFCNSIVCQFYYEWRCERSLSVWFLRDSDDSFVFYG